MNFFVIMLLAFVISSVRADDGADITDPGQVAGLSNLQDQIDSISTAIMSCMDSGKDHKTCMCQHNDMIAEFNASVGRLFSNHPELKKFDLVRFRAPDGMWVSQSLEGIKRQAESEQVCE